MGYKAPKKPENILTCAYCGKHFGVCGAKRRASRKICSMQCKKEQTKARAKEVYARVLARNAEYHRKHPERIRALRLRWYLKNKDRVKLASETWSKQNPDKRRDVARRYGARLRATPKGSLDHRMAVAIGLALKGAKSGRSWEALVGYSVDDLKRSIEARFVRGMSWRALLSGEIHIDHIIPKSKFAYSCTEDPEFRRCWGLENLQPMWALQNLSKGNKLMAPAQIALGI